MNEIIEKAKDMLKKKSITAQNAYSVATYGEKLSDEEIIAKIIARITEIITAKANNGEYAMVQFVDDKIPTLKDAIINHFVELDFKVQILDKEIIPFINGSYLFIYWNK